MAGTLVMEDEISHDIVAKALRSYETKKLRSLETCRTSRSTRVVVNENAVRFLREELDAIGELLEQVGAAPNLEERQAVDAWVDHGTVMR